MTGTNRFITGVMVCALGVTTILAQRTTATQGLMRVTIGDRVFDCHISKPAGTGTLPGLVLIHDRMGLDVDTKRFADRLSAEGFYVIAPDLYKGKVALDADKGRELATVLDENEAVLAIGEIAAYLKFLPDVGDHRVGVIGADMGGRLALLAAARSTDISAAVTIYGKPITDVDSLRRINVPIMGVFGALDDQIPAAEVTAFKEALDKAGRTSIVKSYPDAGHGFLKKGSETFKQDAADAAWPTIIAFLKEAL